MKTEYRFELRTDDNKTRYHIYEGRKEMAVVDNFNAAKLITDALNHYEKKKWN